MDSYLFKKYIDGIGDMLVTATLIGGLALCVYPLGKNFLRKAEDSFSTTISEFKRIDLEGRERARDLIWESYEKKQERLRAQWETHEKNKPDDFFSYHRGEWRLVPGVKESKVFEEFCKEYKEDI